MNKVYTIPTEDVWFNFGAKSLWSNVPARKVRIKEIKIEIVDDVMYGRWAFLEVHFDENDWDVRKDGLIYTDRVFEEDVINYLDDEYGLVDEMGYSEQGMQGDKYVHFDIKIDAAYHIINNAEDAEVVREIHE